MLQTEYIKANKNLIEISLKKRNWSENQISILNDVIILDDRRKQLQTALDNHLAEVNALSRQIGDLMKNGNKDQADVLKQQVGDLKGNIKELDDQLSTVKKQIEDHLLTIPNVLHPDVPFGKSADDNLVYKDFEGELPALPEDALPHWELAEKYNLFDLKLGAKITGSGFVLYRGQGAKLERALINFFLDYNTQAGYEEILPPLLVNEASARGTGQIPDKEAQMYYAEKDDLYLIPTSEVPVTNIFRDEILSEAVLPLKMTSYTPCFRREAGSYGAHVKGLNRVHQFNKVEIVRIEKPEHSYDALHEMLAHVSGLLDQLELPYRILRLCGGDIGFVSAMTYDFEVWSAAQKRWLEVSSVSNFETYQTNRMKCRYRDQDNNIRLAHSLNGSSLALARIVASLLENNQDSLGIKIPKVLRNYFGSDYIK